MLDKRAIDLVPQESSGHGFYSCYFTVPNKDGGLYPIMDLKALYSFIAYGKFRMTCLHNIFPLLKERDTGCLFPPKHVFGPQTILAVRCWGGPRLVQGPAIWNSHITSRLHKGDGGYGSLPAPIEGDPFPFHKWLAPVCGLRISPSIRDQSDFIILQDMHRRFLSFLLAVLHTPHTRETCTFFTQLHFLVESSLLFIKMFCTWVEKGWKTASLVAIILAMQLGELDSTVLNDRSLYFQTSPSCLKSFYSFILKQVSPWLHSSWTQRLWGHDFST